jgi:hypothetical protein
MYCSRISFEPKVISVTSKCNLTRFIFSWKIRHHNEGLASGVWGLVVCWKSTDVSKKHVASIFRVENANMKQVASSALSLGLYFDAEYGGDVFFRNFCWLSTDYTRLYPRRETSVETWNPAWHRKFAWGVQTLSDAQLLDVLIMCSHSAVVWPVINHVLLPNLKHSWWLAYVSTWE